MMCSAPSLHSCDIVGKNVIVRFKTCIVFLGARCPFLTSRTFLRSLSGKGNSCPLMSHPVDGRNNPAHVDISRDALDLAFDFSFQNTTRCRRAWERVPCRAIASPFRGRKIWKRDLSHPFYKLNSRPAKPRRWRNQGALSDDERSSKRRCRDSIWTERGESAAEEVATMSPARETLPAPIDMPVVI